MLNNLFNAIALVALIGAAFLAPAPPAGPPKTMSAAAAGSVARAPVPASTAPTELQAQQQPVPVIRSAPTRPAVAALDDLSRPEAKAPSQSGLDREAAKVAIEADGYKRVRIVEKAANGAWRAKAYRGAAEVVVMVDEAGRVLTE